MATPFDPQTQRPVAKTPTIPPVHVAPPDGPTRPTSNNPFRYTRGSLLTPWQDVGGNTYPEPPPGEIDWTGADKYTKQIEGILDKDVEPRPYTPFAGTFDPVTIESFQGSPEGQLFREALASGLEGQAFGASARGMLGHGNTLAAHTDLSQRLANRFWGDHYKRRRSEFESDRQFHLDEQDELQEIWDAERQLDAMRIAALQGLTEGERREARENYAATLQRYTALVGDYNRRREEFLTTQDRQYKMLMDQLRLGLAAGGAPDPEGAPPPNTFGPSDDDDDDDDDDPDRSSVGPDLRGTGYNQLTPEQKLQRRRQRKKALCEKRGKVYDPSVGTVGGCKDRLEPGTGQKQCPSGTVWNPDRYRCETPGGEGTEQEGQEFGT